MAQAHRAVELLRLPAGSCGAACAVLADCRSRIGFRWRARWRGCRAGAVTPEQFDFANLRWEGGRYGQAALGASRRQRRTGRAPRYVREAASRALLATNRYARASDPDIARANVDCSSCRSNACRRHFLRRIGSAPLPAILRHPLPAFAAFRSAKCDAWLIDLDADGTEEIVRPGEDRRSSFFSCPIRQGGREAGNWGLPPGCEVLSAEMTAGRFATSASRAQPVARSGDFRTEISTA